MLEIGRNSLLRIAFVGVVLGSSFSLIGCGESEGPKVIDTDRGKPKAPSQDGGPGVESAKVKSQ